MGYHSKSFSLKKKAISIGTAIISNKQKLFNPLMEVDSNTLIIFSIYKNQMQYENKKVGIIRKQELCVGLLFVLLVAACNQTEEGFLSSANPSNTEVKNAITEAVSWKKTWVSKEDCVVNAMVANHYYGTAADGTYRVLIGTAENPGYQFESIKITLSDDFGPLSYHDVDLVEYEKEENGIALEKYGKAGIKDYKLLYHFPLLPLYSEATVKNICISFEYKQKRGTESWIFGASFKSRMHCSKDSIKLESFGYNRYSFA